MKDFKKLRKILFISTSTFFFNKIFNFFLVFVFLVQPFIEILKVVSATFLLVCLLSVEESTCERKMLLFHL